MDDKILVAPKKKHLRSSRYSNTPTDGGMVTAACGQYLYPEKMGAQWQDVTCKRCKASQDYKTGSGVFIGLGPAEAPPKRRIPYADEVPPGWRGQVRPRNAPAASTSSTATPKPPPKD